MKHILGRDFFKARKCIFYNLEKEITINSKYYIVLLVCLMEEIDKKRPLMKKKKVLFHQENAPCHKLIPTMAKLRELHFELIQQPPPPLDLVLSDYWLFANLKRMLQGKKFGSNEEVTSETEAYFEAKDKSFNKKGFELLEKRWDQCITQEGDYVDE